MPITLQEFEKDKVNIEMKRGGKNQIRILELLLQDTAKAHTQMEIQKLLEIKNLPAVNCALHSLLNKGFLECRRVEGILYWRAVNGKKISELLSTDSGDSTKEPLHREVEASGESIEGMCDRNERCEKIHRQSSRVRHDHEDSSSRRLKEKGKTSRKIRGQKKGE